MEMQGMGRGKRRELSRGGEYVRGEDTISARVRAMGARAERTALRASRDMNRSSATRCCMSQRAAASRAAEPVREERRRR
eukprot:151540-Hanusia_phi.AAC.1